MDSSVLLEGACAFLTLNDAASLRAASSVMREAVSSHKWNDSITRISGTLRGWRSSFPRARTITVNYRNLTDTDLAHLVGVESLNLDSCTVDGVSELALCGTCPTHLLQAFLLLPALSTLSVTGCASLSGDMLATLPTCLKLLDISDCIHQSITPASVAALLDRGVDVSAMGCCAGVQAVVAARALRDASRYTEDADLLLLIAAVADASSFAATLRGDEAALELSQSIHQLVSLMTRCAASLFPEHALCLAVVKAAGVVATVPNGAPVIAPTAALLRNIDRCPGVAYMHHLLSLAGTAYDHDEGVAFVAEGGIEALVGVLRATFRTDVSAVLLTCFQRSIT